MLSCPSLLMVATQGRWLAMNSFISGVMVAMMFLSLVVHGTGLRVPFGRLVRRRIAAADRVVGACTNR